MPPIALVSIGLLENGILPLIRSDPLGDEIGIAFFSFNFSGLFYGDPVDMLYFFSIDS